MGESTDPARDREGRHGFEAFYGAWAGTQAAGLGAEFVAVLRTAERLGVLADVGAGRSLAHDRVGPLLSALEAFEVVTVQDGSPVAKGVWTTVLDPAHAGYLHGALALTSSRMRAIDALGRDGVDYWRGDDEMRRDMAIGISPDPFDPAAVEMMRALGASRPDWNRIAESGADYLELGCGVAGALLCQVQNYPLLRATGVEISPDLAEVARERVTRLDLGGRVDIICADACELDRPDSADLIFWSQFFFPEPSRQPALEVAYRSLRDGGRFIAPFIAPLPQAPAEGSPPVGPGSPDEDTDTHARRDDALARLVFSSWGIPIRTPDELVAEVEVAGFTDVAIVNTPMAHFIEARH